MRHRLAWLLLAVFTAGCAGLIGLSDEDEARLELHVQNALTFYDTGQYPQAIHQAERALEIEDDDRSMKLIRGFCLLKLGKASNNVRLVDEALSVFEELNSGWGDDKGYRVAMGLGQAHLARSFLNDRTIATLEQRLASTTLPTKSREAAVPRVAEEQQERLEHLKQAEHWLGKVFEDERQGENYRARLDLVVTLNAQGGRDADVLREGHVALVELEQSNNIWRKIRQNPNRTAEARINDELTLESNLQKERMLRDLLATVLYNSRDYEGALKELDALEQRQLMTHSQYYNRARIYEHLARYEEAIADLFACLRERGQHLDYEDDDLAPAIFQKIDELRARRARTSR